MNRVSVIIPSRLSINPNTVDWDIKDPALWLDRAIYGIRHQTVCADAEIVVAIDADAPALPARYDVVTARAPGKGQAQAVNAAVKAATGDVLVFHEDDDYSEPTRFEAQLPLLDKYDLVTCNSREHDEAGGYVRINDFPTGSSWVCTRETWDRVGPMDETFHWHVDTEWLGRANAIGLKRIHLVDTDALVTRDPQRKAWLTNVARFSDIGHVGNEQPLVNRCVNPDGGMSTIAKGGLAAEQSQREHEEMIRRFGGVIPW